VSWDLRCADNAGPEGLSALADKSVDVIATDPPYSDHVHAKSRRGLTQDNRAGATGEISAHRELGFDAITVDQMEACADQFVRLARRWVLVFCDMESAHLWRGALTSAGLEYLRTCAWHKIGGAPQFTGDRPAVWGEAIVCAHQPGRKRWNGGGKQGLYSFPTAIDRDRSGLDIRMHTTQKPVALMEALILDFTDPGETILDAYAGSGTTGVAAIRLGRSFVGFEKDAEMATKARARLASTRELPTGYHGARAQGALL
jgi:site-specific DNA-methyltransferase (adenine-specific)